MSPSSDRSPDWTVSAAAGPGPAATLSGIVKRFPGVTAIDGVDLTLNAGEVHILLGENGAGKSTLVALLAGLQQPDAGVIAINGRPVALTSPRHALALGIGTVFQHSMLAPSLTLVDTMALGGTWWRKPDRVGWAARIRDVGRTLGIALDPNAITGALSLGERQQAEIVRALLRGSRILLLDEATAMLNPRDVDALGALMRRLAGQGLAVLLVTHKLDEALAFGDRVSVLRLGRKVGELDPARLETRDRSAARDDILALMFGVTGPTSTPKRWQTTSIDPLGPTFVVDGLTIADPVMPACDISFEVRAGEILGIAGIDGNGQKPLAEALAGQRLSHRGTIKLDHRPIEALNVAQRRALGLRYVTDDRLGEGTVGTFPVSTNLLLKDIGKAPFWLRGLKQAAAITNHARKLIADFDVRTPGPNTPIGKLSGGNIQKALLARDLWDQARVVVFAKPTHGLDVQNTKAIRARIHAAARAGVATVLISTDLDELLEVADRIAVLAGGRIVEIVPNGPETREKVGALMSGVLA